MLSQLTLRFPKKLIERLKNRAATENTSVNALAERLMDASLESSAAGEEYLRLVTDPDAALEQLYRQLILGQTVGAPAPSRDTLRFMMMLAHQGYSRGQGQLVSLPRLRVLLEISFELLIWLTGHGKGVDVRFLKSTFRFDSDDWQAESQAFLAGLSPQVSQDYAEQLLRPLAGQAFDLQDVPDEVLARIFTVARLQAIFPLCMRARDRDFDARRRFCETLRPVVMARRETIEAGPVKFEIHISGQDHGVPADVWYEMPRLFLVVTGEHFIMPFGWEPFSELLRMLSVRHAHPDSLPRGREGKHALFYQTDSASREVTVGLEAMRVFVPEAGFEDLVRELVTRCEQGPLAQTLDSLRCLWGDL
ncbi:MAG TPA: transcriptional regulator [Scandinavium sp.]|jgi:hypothetical protein